MLSQHYRGRTLTSQGEIGFGPDSPVKRDRSLRQNHGSCDQWLRRSEAGAAETLVVFCQIQRQHGRVDDLVAVDAGVLVESRPRS